MSRIRVSRVETRSDRRAPAARPRPTRHAGTVVGAWHGGSTGRSPHADAHSALRTRRRGGVRSAPICELLYTFLFAEIHTHSTDYPEHRSSTKTAPPSARSDSMPASSGSASGPFSHPLGRGASLATQRLALAPGMTSGSGHKPTTCVSCACVLCGFVALDPSETHPDFDPALLGKRRPFSFETVMLLISISTWYTVMTYSTYDVDSWAFLGQKSK